MRKKERNLVLRLQMCPILPVAPLTHTENPPKQLNLVIYDSPERPVKLINQTVRYTHNTHTTIKRVAISLPSPAVVN